jgi:hypothetical protein
MPTQISCWMPQAHAAASAWSEHTSLHGSTACSKRLCCFAIQHMHASACVSSQTGSNLPPLKMRAVHSPILRQTRPYIHCPAAPCCSVTQDNVDLVKRRWVDAGRPTMPDWKQLLAGIDQL